MEEALKTQDDVRCLQEKKLETKENRRKRVRARIPEWKCPEPHPIQITLEVQGGKILFSREPMVKGGNTVDIQIRAATVDWDQRITSFAWTRNIFMALKKKLDQLLKVHRNTSDMANKEKAQICIGCASEKVVPTTMSVVIGKCGCSLELQIMFRMGYDGTTYYNINAKE